MKKYLLVLIMCFWHTFASLSQERLNFIDDATIALQPPSLGVYGAATGLGNGVVGAIGGSVDVGGLGGASYIIPIDVPNGIAGLQPSISIVYNSQSSNGLLGWGWTVGGLSAITRVNKTLYYDNAMGGANFCDDRFALDGQRLIMVNGNGYGTNGAEYRTEVDGMSKIVSYTENGVVNGPAKFKVWTADGHIMEYGYTDNSRMAKPAYGDTTYRQVGLWLLNKVEDRDGNYVEYHYVIGDANYFLTDIHYTGNGNIGFLPCYTLHFHYDDSTRSDEETTFVGNYTLHQGKLLTAISVRWWNDEISRYDFYYNDVNPSSGYYYNRLHSIYYSKGGVSYNPTTITWGTNDYGTSASLLKTSVSIDPNDSAFADKVKVTGDFNGDGFTDVITVYKQSGNRYAKVYLNDGLVMENGTEVCSFHYHQTIELDVNTVSLQVADFNGDGRDDMVSVSQRNSYPRDWVRIFPFLTKWRNNRWELDYAEKGWDDADGFAIGNGHHANLMIGDFLGRGKTEMMMQIPDGHLVDPHLLYITYAGNNLFELSDQPNTVIPGSVFHSADFNGDGITEIWCNESSTNSTKSVENPMDRSIASIYKMTSQRTAVQFNTDHVYTSGHTLLTGDFNGDGHIDMLTYEKVSSVPKRYVWKINYFKATELFYPYFDITDDLPINDPGDRNFDLFGNPSSHDDYQYIDVMDMNGDGKADLVIEKNENLYILYGPVVFDNRGNAVFSSKQIFSMSSIGLGDLTSTMTLCHGNFLGKENTNILGDTKIFSPKTMTNRYSVACITDGLCNKTAIEYDYLTCLNSSIYHRLTSNDLAEYDIYTTSIPIKAVKRISCQNTVAETPEAVTKYYYSDAYVHKKGHGTLGFRKTASASYINSTRQDSTVTIQSVENVEKHRTLATKSQHVYNALNRLVLKVSFDNSFIEKSGSTLVYVPLVMTKKTYAYSPDDNQQTLLSKSVTDNVYKIDLPSNDGGIGFYANTLKLTDTYEGTTDNPWASHAIDCRRVAHTHTVFQPDNYLSNWIINRPDTTIVTSWQLGDNALSQSVIAYTYRDNTSYHPLTVDSYPGGNVSSANSLATSTRYSYDLAGNVTRETLLSFSETLAPRVTKYSYEQYRFVKSEANTLDYVTENDFSLDFVELTRSVDCNGLSTFYNRSDHLGSTDWVMYPDATYGCTAQRWARYDNIGFYDADAPNKSAYYTWKRISGELPTKVFYDAAGRELRSVSYGLNGDTIYQDTEYNNLGLLFRKSLPYFANETPLWTSYYYDALLRPSETYFPDGTWVHYSYDGLTSSSVFHTTTNETHTSTVVENYFGKRDKSIDDAGTEVRYTYYHNGMLKWTQIGDNTNTRVTMEYDDAGNRIRLLDPNYGEISEVYDAYGQLESTTSPKGDVTEYRYDVIGRITYREETDNTHNTTSVTEWEYYETVGQKGLLKQVRNGINQIVSYIYDNSHLNRLSSKTECLFGTNYLTSYTYDDAGGFPLRIKTVTYPTGFTTQNVYHPVSGKLYRINDGLGNKLWETASTNAIGQVTQYLLGTNITAERSYEAETGRLTSIYSYAGNSVLQNLGYSYDDFGNLTMRYDKMRELRETFGYDRLDRLDSIALNNQIFSRITYDPLGRMLSKQADGHIVFSAAQYDYTGLDGQLRPHAISSAEMADNPFPTSQLNVDYTMFDKVKSIGRSPNPYLFDYGYDHQRIRMHDGANYSKTYVAGCEFVCNSSGNKAWTYLVGPMGVFGVAETIGNTTTVHYVLKDHLGSWTTITNAIGVSEQELSFDAWGLLRNPNTWREFSDKVTPIMFDRGYTGHEHLGDVGLINMNGRMYDPIMSSFLSVDSYVQDPENAQNFNRYAYCLNNPLKYIDPSGESISILGAMAIAAAVSVASTMASNYVNDRPMYEGVGRAAVVGALQGAFSYGIGTVAGIIGNIVGQTWSTACQVGFQVVAHGLLGGISSEMRNGSFWSGFASGAVASFVASYTGGLVKKLPEAWQISCMVAAGGLSGGVTATMAGGDFWEGVCNGLICSGLNHAMHLVVEGETKVILKNIDRFNHVRQSDYWQIKPTRCKYACLEMIEKYFFGDSGRTESELFDSGMAFESKDEVIPFFRRMASNGGNRYFVNLVDDYTPLEMAGKLAAGYPIMMIEWNGNDAHASLIIGVDEVSRGDYQLQIADPLYNEASRVENWNDLTQQKRTTFQLLLFSK